MIDKRANMKGHCILVCFLIWFGFIGSIQARDDAASLQQRAIERIEKFIEHFRKTGDYTGQVSELQQAQHELTESYNGFIRNGDDASAALSLIKLGDVLRLQNKWQDAKTHYQQGYDLAKRADHKEYQARARLGQARAELFALDEIKNKALAKDPQGRLPPPRLDYRIALALAQEAVQLSGGLKDQGLLFDALEAKSSVLRSSGDLDAANNILNRARSVAQASGDNTKIFYGFFDRAGINFDRGYRCGKKDFQGSYSLDCPRNDRTSWCGDRPYRGSYVLCYKALDEASSDYEQALKIAKKLGYTGLEKMAEGQLTVVEQQRCVITVRECRDKGFAKAMGSYDKNQTPEEYAKDQNTRIIQQCSPECLKKMPVGGLFLE